MEIIKKTVKTEIYLTKLLFKTDAYMATVFWVMRCAQYAIPIIDAWLWKQIIDEMARLFRSRQMDYAIWIYLVIILSLQVLSSVITQFSSAIYDRINRKATINMDMAIMEKMAHIDTSFFDNPNNSDKLDAARTSESYITGNMCWAADIIIQIGAFVSGVILFLSYGLVYGVVYIATYIPGAVISYRQKLKMDQWSIDKIPETRRKNYYKSLLIGDYAAKDLRIYNLAGYFKQKYNEVWCEIRNERSKLFTKGAVISFLASLLTYGGLVTVILLSVRSVLHGDMAIGTLAIYIGLAKTSGESFSAIIEGIACQIEIDVPHVIQFIDFLKYENMIKDDGTEFGPIFPEIEFRGVWFKYPGSEEYTLKNICFKIKKGEKIALVGINGAGKTTLIKLLLRFYEPDSGEILVDGKSLNNYPLHELHKLFSVCFQDVTRYSLTLRENIAISDIDRREDDDAIKNAAGASGADSIINSAPIGLETDMTRKFNDNGIEMSGGQWQKIAIARTFFREAQFIILDEPSSSLDPEAEDYIFSSFKRLCRDKGGLLVSHRLSSIIMVDKIVLIDNGAVIESGTHAELMSRNGKYAEMYRMQSEKYTGGVSIE